MTEDSWVLNSYRKAVECDIVEELEESGVQVLEWFDLLGWDSEPGMEELVRKDVVSGDGVHLTAKSNSFAAVSTDCGGGAVCAEQRRGVEEVGGLRRRRQTAHISSSLIAKV